LIAILEVLLARFPDAYVESLTRCKTHNSEVGGSVTSSHLPIWDDLPSQDDPYDEAANRACGADVHHKAISPHIVADMAACALREGATGLGVHPWGIHIDVKPRSWPLLIWKPKDGGGSRYDYLF
jgi:hypothetical protein